VTVYVRSFFVVINAAVPPQFYNCATEVGAKRVCHSNVMSGLVSYKKINFFDTWYNLGFCVVTESVGQAGQVVVVVVFVVVVVVVERRSKSTRL